MQRENVAQLSTDVTTWLNTRRPDINVLTRHHMVRLIEEVAATSNWVKVTDETDLGSVDDEYSEQLNLIQKDIENVIFGVDPMLSEVMSSVIGMAGWRHHV